MQAWRRLGAWRTAPPVSKEGNLQRMVPGFLIGTGMFVVAVDEPYQQLDLAAGSSLQQEILDGMFTIAKEAHADSQTYKAHYVRIHPGDAPAPPTWAILAYFVKHNVYLAQICKTLALSFGD
eukprot:gene7055-7637_t